MSDPLSQARIDELTKGVNEAVRSLMPRNGSVRTFKLRETILALIAAHDRADHRKAAANYAEHVTCQHGREPDAACVPCSWAARIVELERENAALRVEVAVLDPCRKALQSLERSSEIGEHDRHVKALDALEDYDAWKAGSHE